MNKKEKTTVQETKIAVGSEKNDDCISLTNTAEDIFIPNLKCNYCESKKYN